MDAKNMGIKAIKEGISRGCYVLTGILETGEVVIALVNDSVDKKIIEEYLDDNSMSDNQKLKINNKWIKAKGRPAKEIKQIYLQKSNSNYKRCKKNNLIIRKS